MEDRAEPDTGCGGKSKIILDVLLLGIKSGQNVKKRILYNCAKGTEEAGS